MSVGTPGSRALTPHDVDPDRGPHATVVGMLGVIALFFACALAWATLEDLDVAVQARGVVVPPSRVQEVQSLEGGIVEQMLVKPGQLVERGQLLARLDVAQTGAAWQENRQHQLAALVALARVDGLLVGQPPKIEEAWAREAPALVAREIDAWREASREYQAASDLGQETIRRRVAEVNEAHARIRQLSASVRLAEEAFTIEERLFNQGAGSRADFVGAQQKLQTQRAELDAVEQSLPRLSAALDEARANLTETQARMRSQWGAQRTEYQAKAAAVAAALVGHRDRLDRRELRAPISGVVNRILVPTLGGVAAPAKPIIELVPDESLLLMSARIRPTDIGFIRVGQQANVRVLPYDSATHGQLRAEVSRVGADAISDERGEAYFEVQLSAARDQLKLHGNPLAITPGMPLDISILTGTRSVMQYLLKPVLRGIQSSLQER